MTTTHRRIALLTGASISAIGLSVLPAAPAYADSVCNFDFTASPDVSANCTDGNGNGSVLVINSPFGSIPGASTLIQMGGNTATTTGYIESTTAGRGVLEIVGTTDLTYTGTGSTLVTQSTATGATNLILSGDSVTFFSGTLTALGAGSTALSVTADGGAGSGGITGTIDGDINSVGSGVVLNSTNAAGTGNIVLTSTAGNTISAGTGDAINITTAGTGGITVTLGAAVTSTSGNAIETNSTTGNQTITVNGALAAGQEAILATATTGNITVNINASVSSTTSGDVIATTNDGTSTVNVASGVTVVGTTGDVINFYGNGANATLNNSGTIGNATSGHAVFTGINKGVTVNNLSGGVMNGNYDLSDLVDTINNSGTLNIRGANNFYAGADVITNNAGGVINTATGTTFDSLETFTNAGTLNVTGTLTFTSVATALTNSGTLNATGGATTITGQSGFANSGTLNLTDGATNDVLTIDSDFVGSGASRLNIDAGGTTADRLVITGAASGTTQVFVNGVGSIITSPVLVVDTGTSTVGSFVLGSTVATPLIDVTLTRTGQDFFLTSAPNANAFQPLVLGSVASDLWYQSADAYGAYAAQRRGDLTGGAVGLGLWAQAYWNHERYGDQRTVTAFGTPTLIDSRISQKHRGIQGGIDYGFGPAVVGITAGYEGEDTDFRATPGGFEVSGYNIGAYAIAGSDVGFYGGLLAKYDRGHADLTNPAFADVTGNLTLKETGVEGEAGYRLGLGGLKLDLGAGLAWVHSKIEDFASSGIAFDFDSTKSLRGRLGARVEGGHGFFLDAKALHEFKGDSDVTLVSGTAVDTIETPGRGTWGRVEAGFAGHGRVAPMASLFGEFGDVKGWGFRAGLRFGGAVEAPPAYVPPPAPPAPPPPPPATQTCPDGSVILATSVCPAPPPPPPPPPAERGERGE